ncbi:MAG: TonB-dependent receptor, partial [Pseudomonadales bacterium]
MELSAFRFAAASLAFLSLSFGAGTSFAQSNDAAGTLEEVIVTATRRNATLQDVPISISVISADDITATGSVDLKQLASLVPNFVFAASPNQGISNMSIRGIYSRNEPSSIGFDSSVGVYVDNVFHSRQFNANANMGEIERVEVLRGPQGTLFGRNTISGAINITSKKPDTEEFRGNVTLDLGDRSLVHARGSINVPIVEDILALKLFAEVRERDGYVENITTGNDSLANEDKTSGRLQLRYKPSEQTTVDFSASTYDSEADDYFFEYIDGPESDGRQFTVSGDTQNTSEIELFNASLSIEHEFGNGYTLTSVTALLDDELTFVGDVDNTTAPIIVVTDRVMAEQFSQELRIASPADRSYDFVAGLYYDNEESSDRNRLAPGGGFPAPPLQDTFAILGNDLDRTSYAAFIHANFKVSDTLTLFGGLRYTDETKELTAEPVVCDAPFACIAFGGGPGVLAITETVRAPVDVTLHELTYSAGLRYHISDDVMLYGSVSTGVKSGAFNNAADPAAALAGNDLLTEPEYVDSYELGMKSSWLDNRLNLNLAVFRMDYEDLQVRLSCADCGPGGVPDGFLSNAANATSEGLEIDLIAQATNNLRFTMGVGYTDSTYDELSGVENPRTLMLEDAAGNKVPLAAEWTINASASHTAELAGGTLTSRLDVNYIDERFSAQGI